MQNEQYFLEILEKCRLNKAETYEWEELFKCCHPRIYLYLKAISIKYGFSIVELDDVIQDIFIKLMKKFPNVRFISMDKFYKYLDTLSKNYLIDLLRRQKKIKDSIPLEWCESLLIGPDQLLPEKLYERKELRALLLEEIEDLPPVCKIILNSILKEGLTLSEISKRYRIPRGSINNQYRRCITKLIDKLRKM